LEENVLKNLLIIGGSYFAGKTFIEELVKTGGYSIYVLNRGTRPLRLKEVTEIVCDRHDSAKVRELIPALEWQAVIDFCAYEKGDIKGILQNLPRSAQKYIYISTTTVYQNSHQLPMREDTLKLGGPLPEAGGDYAYKKLLLESELIENCKMLGIPYLILRPAFIYGQYNYAPRESYFFNLISRDETLILPSPPQALFSMVSVWDLARVVLKCVENQKVNNNSYNVCAEELISYDRILEVLETITSRKFNVRRQPARIITASGLPLPFPLEEHLIYSGTSLKDILNYQYLPFLQGMTLTYNWFFKRKSIE
jgi:2'-hydroxyisoflavone reductase